MADKKAVSLHDVVGSFALMDADSTCFPVSLANASALLGRKLNATHMVNRLEDEGILKRWNQGVIDLRAAERVLGPYLETHGVRATFHNILPYRELMASVATSPTLPQERGVVAALSYAYVSQYHSITDDLPAEHFERFDYQGAAHDVVLLMQESEDILIFDPEPSLDPSKQEPGWARGVIRMNKERFKVFYHQGDNAREATVVQRMRPVPSKAKFEEGAAVARPEAKLATFGKKGGRGT